MSGQVVIIPVSCPGPDGPWGSAFTYDVVEVGRKGIVHTSAVASQPIGNPECYLCDTDQKPPKGN